jgi:hypothetical protein
MNGIYASLVGRNHYDKGISTFDIPFLGPLFTVLSINAQLPGTWNICEDLYIKRENQFTLQSTPFFFPSLLNNAIMPVHQTYYLEKKTSLLYLDT